MGLLQLWKICAYNCLHLSSSIFKNMLIFAYNLRQEDNQLCEVKVKIFQFLKGGIFYSWNFAR